NEGGPLAWRADAGRHRLPAAPRGEGAGFGVGRMSRKRSKTNRALTPIFPPGVRGHHDMGGLPAGKVEPTEHDYEEWERRVDALMLLCAGISGKKRLMTVDELRKNIEALAPDVYDRLAYYEK